jgi:hypothetical protein
LNDCAGDRSRRLRRLGLDADRRREDEAKGAADRVRAALRRCDSQALQALTEKKALLAATGESFAAVVQREVREVEALADAALA